MKLTDEGTYTIIINKLYILEKVKKKRGKKWKK